MIDDLQDSMSNGDYGALLSASGCDTPVQSGQVSILASRSGMCRLYQSGSKRLVAFARLSRLPFARTLIVAGRYSRPGAQMPIAWELTHISPNLAQDHLCRGHANSANLIKACHGLIKRGAAALDLRIQHANALIHAIDQIKQLLKNDLVMSIHRAKQRPLKFVMLLSQFSKRHIGKNLRVALSANHCLYHRATGDTHCVRGHGRKLYVSVLKHLL